MSAENLTRLTRARRDFGRLLRWAEKQTGGWRPVVALKYSRSIDAENARTRRTFCGYDWKNRVILCSRWIEVLPPEFRIGVLLHELGHVHQGIYGVNDEVRADLWAKKQVPGFEYANVSYNRGGKRVLATSLERVPTEAVLRIIKDGRA